MEELEKEKLVKAWIELQLVEEDSIDYKRNLWSAEKIWELSEEDPNLCWDIILGILNEDINIKVLGNLAAGPLEDLLSNHGPKLIDKVEEEARKDERFRTLLGGVWQNEMSDQIWERVRAVAGEQW